MKATKADKAYAREKYWSARAREATTIPALEHARRMQQKAADAWAKATATAEELDSRAAS